MGVFLLGGRHNANPDSGAAPVPDPDPDPGPDPDADPEPDPGAGPVPGPVPEQGRARQCCWGSPLRGEPQSMLTLILMRLLFLFPITTLIL